MTRRWARRVVSWYPAPWRRRYAAEVLELLEVSPVRVSDVVELVRGLVVERQRALLEDVDNPRRTAALLGWMPSAFALVFSAAAVGIGLALREWTGHTSSTLVVAGWILLAIPMLLSLHGMSAARRQSPSSPHPGEMLVGAWPRLSVSYSLWLPVLFLSIVCFWWGDLLGTLSSRTPRWSQVLIHFWFYTSTAGRLASGIWPQRELLGTFVILQSAEQRLAEARAWVDSCRMWIDRGVDSPLDDAVALVERVERTRDEAQGRLQQLGYRARFER